MGHMKGQVLVFNQAMESGIILTVDGLHLLFQEIDWQGQTPPDSGMEVEFMLHESDQARQVRQTKPGCPHRRNSVPQFLLRLHTPLYIVEYICGMHSFPSMRTLGLLRPSSIRDK